LYSNLRKPEISSAKCDSFYFEPVLLTVPV
jgi:hypothetical protein